MSNLPDLNQKYIEVFNRFESVYGQVPTFGASAPGRVNLIGEHTDYNDGFVLPLAIELNTVVAARRRDDRRVRIMSTGVEGTAEFSLESVITPGEPAWANYVKGAVAGCLEIGLHPRGFDALLHSTVPAGGGLSSSASIEVATATLIEALVGKSIDPVKKALLCQIAEHDFAGMPCGIMDQFISTMGQAGSALLIDCRTHGTQRVPLDDPSVEVLIINSNKKHELVDGEYARCRAQCGEAARIMGVDALRDGTLGQLDAVKAELDDLTYRRARHVIRENERTQLTARALESHDWGKVGAYMFESHASLRDDFMVSTPELDLLVDLAAKRASDDGVIGSRMTGGGFGGCTVTLVRTDQAQSVTENICKSYRHQTGINATAFITRPADGASILLQDGDSIRRR